MSIVQARGLTFAYGSSERPVLRDASFDVREGELIVLAGPSGGGKSTLLRCINGLIPHFHGGAFGGEVRIADVDTRSRQPRELASLAGMVFQEPEAQTVANTVEDEIIFGLENLGAAPSITRKRLEEMLDALSLVHLRNREITTLSGGERQRVAIAAVLTMQPRVLLLDEPTSQLDPQSAQDVLAKLVELRDEIGLTVLAAEHRLERLAAHADRFMIVNSNCGVRMVEPRAAMREDLSAPPVARIGAALGWSPLPLSLAQGRSFAGRTAECRASERTVVSAGDIVAEVKALGVTLGETRVLNGVDVTLRLGEIVALMGRNGAGKTTLLRAIAGLNPAIRSSITFARAAEGREFYQHVAYVAQDPASMLYASTVRGEIADVLKGTQRRGSVDAALDEWQLRDIAGENPRDLSVGQRQRVALAAMLVGAPELILLDEPTRGMDARTADLLVQNLTERRTAGACIVLASHEVELAARCADRVILLADGEVIDDGPPARVLSGSLAFTTQANKLFGGDVLTVEDALAYARAEEFAR